MKAFVFAAGKGERMRPLTDHTPKPLLTVNGKALIDYHLEKLAAAGFSQAMINLSYLGDQIRNHCGNGGRYGLRLHYSDEGPEPLETGGALNQCLDWLAGDAFAMISTDAYTDLPYNLLAQSLQSLQARGLCAELVLAANPPHNPDGDFGLAQGLINTLPPRYTYTGLGTARFDFINDYPGRQARFPIRDALQHWQRLHKLGGFVHRGLWQDVGTPERLAALQGP
ncbi:nucleotidyltransferase family protein [Simiduia sp. 21SJ11W-1]|uniref:nucleotidyltransferase family protein n=1 Tax=Simiduia sp. 21SJ11W-1 TaxID=2909669 RepID=UPI0020A0322C|nr:nucleotidyltransferase family protein [Simiduia sp. 21SJ11W-1]UTA48603.1 nucleotidyltransferase family protein [Simiduia sp. 21SJ11W-1]